MQDAAGAVIGAVIWFVIDESSLPTIAQASAWFAEAGLNRGYLPEQVTGIDAFRRASGEIADTGYIVDDRAYILDVVEAEVTAEYVTRNIMRRAKDPDIHGTVDKVAELQFFRPRRVTKGTLHGTETWRHQLAPLLPGQEREVLAGIIRDFSARYEAARGSLSSRTLRAAWRRELLERDAITLKPSGGIYWVDDDAVPAAAAMAAVMERCGGSNFLAVVPLLDSPAQRRMLAAALAAQTVDDANAIVAELAHWRRRYAGQVMSIDRHRAFSRRYRDLVARATRLAARVDAELPAEAASAAEAAAAAVTAVTAMGVAPARARG